MHFRGAHLYVHLRIRINGLDIYLFNHDRFAQQLVSFFGFVKLDFLDNRTFLKRRLDNSFFFQFVGRMPLSFLDHFFNYQSQIVLQLLLENSVGQVQRAR